jgi:hypothetical protein
MCDGDEEIVDVWKGLALNVSVTVRMKDAFAEAVTRKVRV